MLTTNRFGDNAPDQSRRSVATMPRAVREVRWQDSSIAATRLPGQNRRIGVRISTAIVRFQLSIGVLARRRCVQWLITCAGFAFLVFDMSSSDKGSLPASTREPCAQARQPCSQAPWWYGFRWLACRHATTRSVRFCRCTTSGTALGLARLLVTPHVACCCNYSELLASPRKSTARGMPARPLPAQYRSNASGVPQRPIGRALDRTNPGSSLKGPLD